MRDNLRVSTEKPLRGPQSNGAGRHFELLAALPAASAQLLQRSARGKRYRDGALVMQRGQAVTAILLLQRGRLRTLAANADGHTRLFRWLEAGEAVGLASALAELPFQIDLEASGECEVLWIPVSALLEAMRSDPAVGLAVARLLSTRLGELFDHVVAQAEETLPKRLAAVLANLATAHGQRQRDGRVRLQLTQADVAEAAGASRQRTNEALRRMQARGQLVLGYRRIELPRRG